MIGKRVHQQGETWLFFGRVVGESPMKLRFVQIAEELRKQPRAAAQSGGLQKIDSSALLSPRASHWLSPSLAYLFMVHFVHPQSGLP